MRITAEGREGAVLVTPAVSAVIEIGTQITRFAYFLDAIPTKRPRLVVSTRSREADHETHGEQEGFVDTGWHEETPNVLAGACGVCVIDVEAGKVLLGTNGAYLLGKKK